MKSLLIETKPQLVPTADYSSRGLLRRYLKPYWLYLLAMLALLLIGVVLDLLNPRILGTFIDTVSNSGSVTLSGQIALLFAAVIVVRQVVTVIDTYIASTVQISTTNRARADLFAHCLGLDLAFYQEHLPGELIERVDGDISTLGNFLSRFVVSILGNALLLLAVLIFFYTIDWRLGLALSLFVLVIVVLLRRLQNVATPLWEKVRQNSADLFGFLEERFTGTEDIRSSGADSHMLRGLTEQSRGILHATRRARVVGAGVFEFLEACFTIGTVIALAMGAWLYLTHAITLGMVVMIFGYTELLRRPLTEFQTQMQDVQQAFASLQRMRAFFETRSQVGDGNDATLPPGALSVEFADVSFAYTPEIPVLRSLSFALPAGAVLGVLGRTGSGKTTLTKLLERFYDPTEGVVRLGDVNLRQVSVKALRKRIGMITQEVHIFHASVRENLTLFDPQISDERIGDVLELLGMGQWLRALPEGLETRLETNGTGLSAGEAQLLAFARVFLRDPDLVILDEASSRLDPVSERRIELAMDQLLAGRTAIIIAHRLTTVQRADALLILEDGCCQEFGTRVELAADPHSRFSHLLRTGLIVLEEAHS